jgi:hypothetical protein
MRTDPIHPAIREVISEDLLNSEGHEINDILDTMGLVLETGRDHADRVVPDGVRIVSACAQMCALLLVKNAAYGGSAADPVAVFSDANPNVRLAVRMDDKLARIKRGHELAQEDAMVDLAGYLLLYVAQNLPDQNRRAT